MKQRKKGHRREGAFVLPSSATSRDVSRIEKVSIHMRNSVYSETGKREKEKDELK